MIVMMVLMAAMAAGVGVPSVVMQKIRKDDQKKAQLRDAQKAQKKADKRATRQRELAEADRRRDAKLRAAEAERQRQRLLEDPVAMIIPAMRAALEAGVRQFELRLRELRALIERKTVDLAEAEDEVAAAEKALPPLLKSDTGRGVARALSWLAVPACVAFASLDWTMYRATHDPLLAAAYAVLTMIVVSVVGLWLIAAVPGLFRTYKNRAKQYRGYLSASGAIIGAILMLGLLLWLAPYRSQAQNDTKIASAESHLARLQAQVDAGDPDDMPSQESIDLATAEVDRANATATTDRAIDQAIVLVAMTADVVCLEGALVCLTHLGPLSQKKQRASEEKAVLSRLYQQRDQVQEGMLTHGRQVATSVWQTLTDSGVANPADVIAEAMRQISIADLDHNAVQTARMERFGEAYAAAAGRDVVRGEIIVVDGHPAQATEAGQEQAPESTAASGAMQAPGGVEQPVEDLDNLVVDEPDVPTGGLAVGGDRYRGGVVVPGTGDHPAGGWGRGGAGDRHDPMQDIPDLDDLVQL